jgi:penicillin V acylase-like amidase (Ntn superfamily)
MKHSCRSRRLQSAASILVAGILLAHLPGATLPARACTAFVLQRGEERAVCRNFDWETGTALLLVNPRGLGKSSLATHHPAKWAARYGSVTVNQFGREMPLEGMNEAGLVVATLWLDETSLPADTTLPSLGSLQWVQFMLDQAATVPEALALDSTVVITPGAGSTVHFFLADAEGGSAVIEYLDGRRVHHTGATLPVAAITNDTYEHSREFLNGLKPFGGTADMPTDMGSLPRFARAVRYQGRFAGEPDLGLINHGFASLASVSSGLATQWSAVYDQPHRRVWIRTQRNQQLRAIDFSRFDFTPASGERMLEIDAGEGGDVSPRFVAYTTQANRDLIFRTFGSVSFLKGVPDDAKEQLARFPESLPVVEIGGGR